MIIGRRQNAPPPGRRLAWACAAALITVGIGGCAVGGLPREEVIDRPIAVVHWSDEESRRRRDIFEQAKLPPGAIRGSGAEGVATPDGLARLLGAQPQSAAELSARLAQFPGRLALVDPRTGHVERVDAAAPGARPLAWSPDHRDLLFASDRISGSWQLFIYNRKTREVRSLTIGDEAHHFGDWSSDDRFLYTGLKKSRRSYEAHVYVTGKGGRDPRPVFDGAPGEVRFAPDGEHALLVRPDTASTGRRGRPPILILKSLVDPDEEERVVARGRNPAVSADGRWVVYSAAVAEGWRLMRIRPDGAGRSRVGRGVKDETMPAVSPDGRHVVYVAEEGDFDRLFVKRIDGSGDRVLLDEGSVAWPVW